MEKKPRFTFSTYKLACKNRRKYNFHCAVIGCGKVFNSVRNWNSHHLFQHRAIKYKCKVCCKWISTPNRLRDHIYTHQEKWFKCGRCDKTFLFQSGLNLHRNYHWRIQAYECFANNCKKYKWPQDLLRHIKVHLKVILICENCEYSMDEMCLL